MIRTRIGGRTWRIVHAPAREMPKDADGDCSHPPGRCPTIRIRRALRAQRRLEIEVHELLHASRPELAEEAVAQTAAEVSSALWRIGWRVQ